MKGDKERGEKARETRGVRETERERKRERDSSWRQWKVKSACEKRER